MESSLQQTRKICISLFSCFLLFFSLSFLLLLLLSFIPFILSAERPEQMRLISLLSLSECFPSLSTNDVRLSPFKGFLLSTMFSFIYFLNSLNAVNTITSVPQQLSVIINITKVIQVGIAIKSQLQISASRLHDPAILLLFSRKLQFPFSATISLEPCPPHSQKNTYCRHCRFVCAYRILILYQ